MHRLPKKDDKNTRLKNACAFLHKQHATLPPSEHLSLRKVSHKYGVNYSTLSRRFNGQTHNPHFTHESQQSLSHVQEKVLVEWIKDLSLQGMPLSKRDLQSTVERITGGRVKPPANWIRRLLKRHPELKLGRPRKLDAKRGQAFNKTTVHGHFLLLEKIITEFDIPWENVWNMDEKGCQRGGGGGSHEKVFVARTQRDAYEGGSNNLDLITVIKCVSAVGDSIKPGFIFSESRFHRGWLEVDEEIV